MDKDEPRLAYVDDEIAVWLSLQPLVEDIVWVCGEPSVFSPPQVKSAYRDQLGMPERFRDC